MSSVLDVIREKKVVAIVRGIDSAQMCQTVDALLAGGVSCIEVTFDQSSPARAEDTLKSLALIKSTFGERVALGAGTVLTTQQVDAAVDAGAEYIISPNADDAVIRYTKKLGKISIPGAFTPTEAVAAHRAGADIVKLFPAALLGTAYIKALRGPLGHIPFTAVGGVDESNFKSFLDAGACGVGVGGNLVNKKLIEAGRFDEITRLAALYRLD